MKKRRSKGGILTEAAHQLAEAAVSVFGVGSRTLDFVVDGSKVKVAVAIESKHRYEVQVIADPSVPMGRHFRITDMNGDNRVATCYDEANAMLVTHALNAMEKRTPTGKKR